MPNLSFDFTWYKDPKGYRLVPGKPVKRRPGQSILDAVLEMPAAEVEAARIVGNGGRREATTPLRIETLFVQFSKIETPEQVLRFVQTHGPLTGGKVGDRVKDVIAEAREMRHGVSKSLGKLLVSIETTRGETQLRVRPACLLDALWIQYAQANAPSRQCPQCGGRFLVADRRRDAKFCADECRVKFNSLKRSRR